jgi:hypothetical protein
MDNQGAVSWIDPAGYEVARSAKPDGWNEHEHLSQFQFELHTASGHVTGEPYLPHR